MLAERIARSIRSHGHRAWIDSEGRIRAAETAPDSKVFIIPCSWSAARRWLGY